VLGAAPGGDRSLLLFPDRRGADAWSARVPGFAAEPLAGPMAVNVAELAEAELMVLDPLGAAFPIDRRTMEWRCPRAARPRATFAECASAWIERDTPETFSALLEVWRYAVFYVQVVKPGHAAPADTAAIVHASVGGCRLLLDLDGDTAYLTGNTERAAVEGWCAGGDYLCLALDGPALLEAASLVGADVGVMVGLAKTFAIGADDRDLWPRRPLTTDDL
jgi:hypothetical protein